MYTLSLWMSWKRTVSFLFFFLRKNLTIIHQGSYYNSCQYYRHIFEVETWNLFISLVCFSFLHRCCAQFCLPVLVYEPEKLLGEKLSGAVSQLWSLFHTFIKPFFFKHILCPLKACYCFITLWLVIEPLDMLPTSWLSKAISFSCRSDPIVTDIRPGH